MAKVRVILLVFVSLSVALAFGIVLFLKVYLSRPEAAVRLGWLLSRFSGIEITIGRIEGPSGWTALGPVILDHVVVSRPGLSGQIERIEVPLSVGTIGQAILSGLAVFDSSTQKLLFRAQRVKLQSSPLALLQGEVKFRWIEVEGPMLPFEGPPFKECDVAFAYTDRALKGWADLERGAHRVPVDRLQLQRGTLAMARFRFSDLKLKIEGWGQPLHDVQLSGKFAFAGSSLPFHAEARISAVPFRMTTWIRFEEAPLAPFQPPLLPALDLKTSRATALLTLILGPGEVEGTFQATAQGIVIRGGQEPWAPTFQARFQVNPAKGEASVSEAVFTAPGVQARGEGKIGCGGERVAYAIEMKGLVVNLAEFQKKAPGLLGGAGGRFVIHALEARGVWPGRPPNLRLTGSFKGMGPFSFQEIGLLDLNGQWQIEGDLEHLKAKAILNSILDVRSSRFKTRSPKAPGNRQPPARASNTPHQTSFSVTLTGSIQGNGREGDFTLGPMKIQVDPLGRAGPSTMLKAGLTGMVQRWGKASAELETGPLRFDLSALNQLIASPERGLTVEALEPPSLHLRLQEGWEAWTEFRDLSLRMPGRSARLKGMKVKLLGRGIEEIEGTILGRSLSVDGHLLEGFRLAFAFHDGRLTVKNLEASAYGGEVEGEGAFVPSTSEGELRLHIQRLRLGSLAASLEAHQGLHLPLPPESQASPFQMSAAVSLQMNRDGLSFRLKTEPVQATEVAAFVLGGASGLPVELRSGEVFGEVVGSGGRGTGDGGLELSGTLSLKKVGVHLSSPWQRGGFQPLMLSLEVPFEYRGGTFRFWGDQVLRARGGEVVLSWQGQFSSQGFKVAGQGELRKLELALQPPSGGGVSLSGTVPFRFEEGLLKVPEVPLTVGDQAQIFLAATLPLDGKAERRGSLKLLIPPTKTSSLKKTIPGLLPRRLLDAELQGILEAKVEIVGDHVQGEVRVQDVGTSGGIVSVQGLSGRIPLFGRLGVPSKVPGERWRELSEQLFKSERLRSAQPAVSRTPGPGSPSLTISSLSYAGLTLRDLTVHFSTQNGPLVIDHLSFRGLGGRGLGRGLLDLFGGSLHLQLLVEGLSLHEICEQFPPIKGYISGKVNGMLELSLPLLEPSQAKGRARFWAVESKEEPRKISKALLEHLGGRSGGFFSLFALRGDRPYDHGLLEVTLQDQLLTFHRLEISNTLLFIKDLDIKVVPPYNTIAIQDLFDTIQETWERIQG